MMQSNNTNPTPQREYIPFPAKLNLTNQRHTYLFLLCALLVPKFGNAAMIEIDFSSPAIYDNPAVVAAVPICYDNTTGVTDANQITSYAITEGFLKSDDQIWDLAGMTWTMDETGRYSGGFALANLSSSPDGRELSIGGPYIAPPPNRIEISSFAAIVTDANGGGILAAQPYIATQGGDCPTADTDGDGLPDDWEINGLDTNGDDVIDLDLPAMGANPNHKDLFVEIDYMALQGAGGHLHQLKQGALDIIIESFRNAPVNNPDGSTGINIHLDAGAATVMNPADGTLWGNLSQSNSVAHQAVLGDGMVIPAGLLYDWTAFDEIKAAHFSASRRAVFRYSVMAHDLWMPATDQQLLGLSRGIEASDFVVSLGSRSEQVGTVGDQAGVFMHELGHNLNLRHGGADDVNNKPNYLSIMNYSYVRPGLRIDGQDANYDFSRREIASLNENALIDAAGVAAPIGYGTRYKCSTTLAQAATAGAGSKSLVLSNVSGLPNSTYDLVDNQAINISVKLRLDNNSLIAWNGIEGNTLLNVISTDLNVQNVTFGLINDHALGAPALDLGDRLINNASGAIDWNCDGNLDDGPSDINQDGVLSNLVTQDDWNSISYSGGQVGLFGVVTPVQMETVVDEIDEEIFNQAQTPFAVSIGVPMSIEIVAGNTQTVLMTVTNIGDNADSYSIDIKSIAAWADATPFPYSIELEPGESAEIPVTVTVPAGTPTDAEDTLTFSAHSDAQTQVMDSGTLLILVADDSDSDNEDICPAIANIDQVDSDGDGVGDACEIDSGNMENTAPYVDSLKSQFVMAGTKLQYNIIPSDDEKIVPGMYFTNLPDGATFIDQLDGSRTLSWIPSVDEIGTYNFNLVLTDGQEPTLISTRILEVVVGSPSSIGAPNINPIDDQFVSANSLLEFVVTPTITDGGVPNLYMDIQPNSATFTDNHDGTRTFNWQTTGADIGEHVVKFVIEDADDPNLRSSVEIKVLVLDPLTGENQVPYLEALENHTISVGELFELRVIPVDPEGVVPDLYIMYPPRESLFEDNLDGTRTFKWAPEQSDTGKIDLTFVVRDAVNPKLTSEQTIVITVEAR